LTIFHLVPLCEYSDKNWNQKEVRQKGNKKNERQAGSSTPLAFDVHAPKRIDSASLDVYPALANNTPTCHPISTKEKKMSRKMFYNLLAVLMLASLVLSACGAPAAPAATQAPAKKTYTYADMTLCYPQLGAESDWRTANTASFKETAQKLGVKLIFSDAQQKQENQISAIRSCIQQGVNVIALPPVVETGWDAVLQEAKDANIPVIVVDRSVTADASLYAAHIGSDMVIEGKRSAEEFNKLLPNGGNILELSGTTGSGAAVGRAKGFREALNPNIKIIDSQTGNFTRAEGKPVMEAFLKKYAGQIDGVFFHNDDMAIGAVEAIKAAGLKPGDLKMVSIDGTRGGFQLMIDGWLQADVECNPLLGPQTMELALKLMNGEAITKEVLTNESVFYPDKAAELLPTRQY
jgi:simple sugar transport system substrate-binding protein